MTVVFVGDKPSKRTDPKHPFKGAACEKRLISWIKHLNLGNDDYIIFNRVDFKLGYEFAAWLNIALINDYPVVALGNEAAKFLSSIHYDNFFKMPHPSGRNRQLNSKEFTEEKLIECKKYIEFHKEARVKYF